MRPMDLKYVLTGVLFLLTLASGVWLTQSGKPLNVAIFTIHKLIALATVIVIAVTIYQLQPAVDLRLIGIIVTGGLLLALFISGAVLSIGRPALEVALILHKVIPLLAAASTAGTLWLLARGQ
jgi:hypothetical protein